MPASRRLLELVRPLNRLVVSLAGTRWLPLYGVIEHRGRRTGRRFWTPVVVRQTQATLVVPLPWGERTDWYRNVRQAGECRIRWQGRTYRATEPELVSTSAVRGAFPRVQYAIMTRAGIRACVRFRLAPD